MFNILSKGTHEYYCQIRCTRSLRLAMNSRNKKTLPSARHPPQPTKAAASSKGRNVVAIVIFSMLGLVAYRHFAVTMSGLAASSFSARSDGWQQDIREATFENHAQIRKAGDDPAPSSAHLRSLLAVRRGLQRISALTPPVFLATRDQEPGSLCDGAACVGGITNFKPMPLPTAPQATPSPKKMEAGSSPSAAWRLRACDNSDALWDVSRLRFFSDGTEINIPADAILSSGSAADPEHGGVTGYEASQALRDDGSIWGGRTSGKHNNQLFLGARLGSPVTVDCMQLTQCNLGADPIECPHRKECVFLEREVDAAWILHHSFEGIPSGSNEKMCVKTWKPKPKSPPPPMSQEYEDRDTQEIISKYERPVDPNTGRAPVTVVLYTQPYCKGAEMQAKEGEVGILYKLTDCPGVGGGEPGSIFGGKFPDGSALTMGNIKSVRVVGEGEVDLHEDCGGNNYWASVLPIDGCTNLYTWPPTRSLRFVYRDSLKDRQGPQTFGEHGPVPDNEDDTPKYRVTFSAESSEYHGFQTQAVLYSFIETQQAAHGGRFTRLLTAGAPDDMVDQFPTFQAKRHPYSKRYSPLNKADVSAKWMASVHAPGPDEVIIMIDPDNWLLQPLEKWAAMVRPGFAVAQGAWFGGQIHAVRQLWDIFCRRECQAGRERLHLSAVPYVVHSLDFAKIAPLWKIYTLLIKEGLDRQPDLSRRFAGLQIDWCVEMYGYVFAGAELGIHHDIQPNMQVRDVDGVVSKDEEGRVPMLHIGRAWLKPSYTPAKRWMHTEGAAWKHRGTQVWCKCNFTAGTVVPWPVPDMSAGTDFQSWHTLRILHGAQEKFGILPTTTKYRKTGRAYSQAWP
ncbi:hypothetical protein CYMTET_14475 [Cymbomonas tetramitiformis]|uniref:Hydroxyproline O-arabinosyltransferase-like domain-containing protein n=1 Tax=Cymbomonas tetramitiformis TaxID=36881 RepID=A0AAE0GG90_9CHLO|nr:hypothetical protein CYMTET_14475 [Cymbomonas tetramitiformis]